ncbi:MAG: hypothetical protein U5N56_08475 [Candidatus Marinimicrobia bacterium]|nr:hypothetical protein [Candidatus Neomarinimicrobiota bacterium]
MKRNIILITGLAILFAYIESSFIVYLHNACYGAGFDFPLKMMAMSAPWIEIGREFVSLLFILMLAVLAAKHIRQIFAYAALAFGLWDFFYYFWLYVFLGWPESLLSPDLLFLIPLPWTGPVLSPLLVSAALVFIGLTLLIREVRGREPVHFNFYDRIGALLSLALILLSYFWNAGRLHEPLSEMYYPWWIFTAGLITGLAVFIRKILFQGQADGKNT